MATQAIQVGGTVAVRAGGHRRSHAAVGPSVLAAIRWAVIVIALVLGLCGMVTTTSWAASTAPPDGPAAGLDL